jgi:eukaryotic-like serine/threonine-protein kinase
MTPDLREQLQTTLGSAYTLERELGGGGMSRVFVADETRLGRKVVVKLLSPELAAGVSAERFEREIRTAASLQQANIVPVLSTGDTNGLPYYTMPFVEGQSLRARLAREGALSITEIVRILGDVARALAYAHEHGVVHRDIKPDNVLLSGGTAVVTDFGIAKALSASRTLSGAAPLTQLGTSLGTPAYMSPEQAAGDPDVDHRADIYAFGCMAYELLTGRPPFAGRTSQRVLAAQMGETPQRVNELRTDTPGALADLVMRCLAKDAGGRPQSAIELVGVLDTVSSGSGLTAMPPILVGGRAMLRRALVVYAAAFVVVAVVAKAAIIAIGLPDWVFPGAIVVMVLGLPVILFTGYVHRTTYRALTATPSLTPGGGTQPRGTLATIAVKASPHVTWRRTALGGAYALGSFVLLVGGFMVLRALGIGPAGSLLAAGKVNQRERLLISDFHITNADSTLGRVASEAVRQALSESAVISVVAPATVAAALERMQRPPNVRLDISLARELAIREGLKAIVDGDVAGVGNTYILTLRLVTADSGNVLASLAATGDGPTALIEAADKAARALRGRIGESLRRVQSTAPLMQVTTGSLDALRKYSEAVRANSYEHDYPKAVALLRDAVELDTAFAGAWRLLGVALNNARISPMAMDSAFERAFRLRDHLSKREQLAAIGSYYGSGSRRDRTKTISAWDALIALGDSGGPANYLGLELESRRDFARAESAFTFDIRSRRNVSFAYAGRFRALMELGRLNDAKQAAAAAVQQFPNAPELSEDALLLRYHTAELDAFRHGLDSLVDGRDLTVGAWALRRRADLALRDGRIAQSLRDIEHASIVDSTTGHARTPLADAAAAAMVDVVLRDSSVLAARRLDSSMAHHPFASVALRDRPYFIVASTYAAAGRAQNARAILAAYHAEVQDTGVIRAQQPKYHTTLGEIALVEGRYRDAIAEFQRGDQLPDGPADACTGCLPLNLGRVYDAAQQPDSAIAMFERYLSVPFWGRYAVPYDPLYLARIQRRLGELYEAEGDRAKAAAYYQKFVDLWKNADPELQPKVAEVRLRLARLKDLERR